MKPSIIIFLLLLSPLFTWALTDSCWTVILTQKGRKLKIKPDMSIPNKTGFYLYRNCYYDITLKDGKLINGRLIDIKPDTLYFSNFLDAKVAEASGQKLDTLAVQYKQLRKFNFSVNTTKSTPPNEFDAYYSYFKKDVSNCAIASQWKQLSPNDSTLYELVPECTLSGRSYVYDDHGLVIAFGGDVDTKSDLKNLDTDYHRKNIAWFTPNKVEEINGLALGIFTKNIKNDRDSLKINGVCIEVSVLQGLGLGLMGKGLIDDIDIDTYKSTVRDNWESKINGINLGIATVNRMQMRGINLSLMVNMIYEMHGLSVSAFSNDSYIMHGASAVIFFNTAIEAKGLQIGLVNKAADMRGIQLGLWNVNGRRSLPLINWQFKPSKPKKSD